MLTRTHIAHQAWPIGGSPRLSLALPARKQRGLSIVELLVGVAIGLLVVAGAALVASSQLAENRRLLLEAQIQQDLRAAADIITRQVRRSGAMDNPAIYIWDESATSPALPLVMDDATPTAGPDDKVAFRFSRGPYTIYGSTGGPRGFQLSGTALGVLMPQTGIFQELTDHNSIRIDSFTVTPRHVDEPTPAAPGPQRLPCPTACPTGSFDSCWPLVRVREFVVDIQATAVHDSAVKRSLQTVIQPRNNELLHNGTTLCPT